MNEPVFDHSHENEETIYTNQGLVEIGGDKTINFHN